MCQYQRRAMKFCKNHENEKKVDARVLIEAGGLKNFITRNKSKV